MKKKIYYPLLEDAFSKEDIEIGLQNGIKLMKEGEEVVFLFPSHSALGIGGDSDKIPTVFELFHSHAVIVEETVGHMLAAVSKATKGDDPSEEIEATIASELKALKTPKK